MAKDIIPCALNEDKFTLGRGMRGLAGNYQAFTSAAYITGLLLEKLDTLNEKNRKQLDAVYVVAAETRVGAWCAEGVPILTRGSEINPEKKSYMSDLVHELNLAKTDLENLASKTSKLWNLFYKKRKRSEKKYQLVRIILDRALNLRHLGKKEEYESHLAQLDEIAEELS